MSRFKNSTVGWRCSSGLGVQLRADPQLSSTSMCQALGSIPGTTDTQKIFFERFSHDCVYSITHAWHLLFRRGSSCRRKTSLSNFRNKNKEVFFLCITCKCWWIPTYTIQIRVKRKWQTQCCLLFEVKHTIFFFSITFTSHQCHTWIQYNLITLTFKVKQFQRMPQSYLVVHKGWISP